MTSTTGLIGLGAQVRAVLEQLPPEADATVRVRHGVGPALAEAGVWVASASEEGVLARRYDLPAAVGLRMGLVEEALDKAGVLYPTTDLGLRARWRRVTSASGDVLGYELAVRAPTYP